MFIAVLLLSSCSELSEYDAQQVQSYLNDSLTTTTESWDVEMMLMNNGRSRVLIEGSYAISYQMPERKETHIDGPVYVQLFDSTGAIETEAWSKRAIYYDSRSEFELFDSVRVHTQSDNRLYSDFLKWSDATDQITSDHFVIIITPKDSLSGRGFSGPTNLATFTIEEPRGRLLVE
ncbi:LPS export ABC transporter periplasmic protein LptC [Rhodohalobacter sp. 8-1]|uniref:LPS export ABC transporter periplasmic protein LptC n=1 Tax=Rhodohalobacter sp. 8-1 TaxID=3131972 RepID=UPI0030EDAE9E